MQRLVASGGGKHSVKCDVLIAWKAIELFRSQHRVLSRRAKHKSPYAMMSSIAKGGIFFGVKMGVIAASAGLQVVFGKNGESISIRLSA